MVKTVVLGIKETEKTIGLSLGADGRTLVVNEDGPVKLSGPASLVDSLIDLLHHKSVILSIRRRIRIPFLEDRG
jgi:hypothetical protein